MQTIQAGYPLQVIAVDITGPFPESQNGNTYVLVVGDHFTKWMEAYAIPNQDARTVAAKLVDEVFCRFSPPEQLHSDQGRQFESELMKEICKILRINKTRTTPYHPQGDDGLVERFNCTLKSMLSTTLRDYPFDWEDRLRKVCMAYNTSIHSSTGYSPFYLMFGREARLPLDTAYGTKSFPSETVESYASHMRTSLTDAYSDVRHHLEVSHQRQKEIYDRRVHGEPYKEGDLVWLFNPAVPLGQSKKLHHPWTGPFTVLKRLSEADYRIKEVYGKKMPSVVHFDRLKLCQPGTRFPQHGDGSDNEISQGNSLQQEQPTNIFDLELVHSDDDIILPRPSSRQRHQPDHYLPVVVH